MGTKYGQPFAGSRVFAGRKYTYLTYEDTKRGAQKRAEYQRKVGGLARVTREVSPMGKVIYVVWAVFAKFGKKKGG